MKFFLIKFSYYLILIFIFLGILDFYIFPRNNNVMTFKNSLLKRESKQVVILGNSHTFFGLKPSLLKKKAINIANKARKLETDYFILRKNLSKLKDTQVIILPISYYSLFTRKITKEEKRLYYHFYGIEKYNQNFFDNSLLLNNSFSELIKNIFIKYNKVSPLGWRANKENYKFNLEIIKEKVGDIDEKISRKQIIQSNIIYLKRINELCIKKNIKLILLLPPYHPDFYKYSENVYNNKIKQILANLNLESSILIDSKKLNIVEDIYFENVDHLNENGAIVFTKKIDSIINNVIDE